MESINALLTIILLVTIIIIIAINHVTEVEEDTGEWNILDLCIKNPKVGQQVWYHSFDDTRGFLVGNIKDIKIEPDYNVKNNTMQYKFNLLLTVDFEEIKDADNRHLEYIEETKVIHQEEAFDCIENLNIWLNNYVL